VDSAASSQRQEDRVTSKHFTAADCLALVERSPAAVADHDRDAWMQLFARYSLVEDPVGSAPHIIGIFDRQSGYRSADRLRRFYETFIAPNTIRFDVYRDIVCGLHVVRDLTIEITMAPHVVVRVPMHLLYELTVEDNVLKIFRLAAHWELRPMLRQQMTAGWQSLKVGNASALRMMRHQGVAGMAGFMRALRSVGDAGKAHVERFAQYFNAGNVAALESLFAAPDTLIAFPHASRYLSISACADEGGALKFGKLLAAGNVVSATMDYSRAGESHQGVAFFELDIRRLLIVAASFYWAPSQDVPGVDG
jgi:hypothetical protein